MPNICFDVSQFSIMLKYNVSICNIYEIYTVSFMANTETPTEYHQMENLYTYKLSLTLAMIICICMFQNYKWYIFMQYRQ